MYTDKDLNRAVSEGIFTEDSVSEFRHFMSLQEDMIADQESFRLIGGFNDIFTVIACSLLLFSSFWVLRSFSEILGYLVFAGLSWLLAEVFVLKRKMALPAIVLLLAFVGSVFMMSSHVFNIESGDDFFISAGLSALAAYCHWRRFHVPITVAVGTGAGLALLASLVVGAFPKSVNLLLVTAFCCGCITFFLAMLWDSSDRERKTRRADIAFWLHLLAAPLIIHPIFWGLGILNGSESMLDMLIIIMLYFVLAYISIVIDRRAFMLSSMTYAIYALFSLIQGYDGDMASFAITGGVLGTCLLLAAIFWQKARFYLVSKLPSVVQAYVPVTVKS